MAELRVLLDRLRSGGPLTAEDVVVAERRATESATMAGQAEQNSSVAHTRAADAHRSAARAAHRNGRLSEAHRHEEAALADDVAASADLPRLVRRQALGDDEVGGSERGTSVG